MPRSCSNAVIAFLIALLAQPALADDDQISVTPDVVYGHKAGMALTFDVVKPSEPNGVGILFMMSGGWVSRWTPPEALLANKNAEQNVFFAIVDAGYTLFVVRHGSSPYFKVPEAVADVQRAVRFIRLHASEFGVDPGRLGVTGGSAGGHLSLMLGTASDEGNAAAKDPVERISDRVAAVVSYFPPTKIDEFFPLKDRFPALDFDASLADAVSPLVHVTSDDAPTLLIHGDMDTLVPLDNSERILQAFEEQNVDAKLIVIPGAAHGFRGEDNSRAIRALIDWFNGHLLAK